MFERDRLAGRLQAALLFSLVVLLALPGLVAAKDHPFPSVIPLPVGFMPEGIASGRGTSAYTGSLTSMGIYRIDLRTRDTALLPGTKGRTYTGMKVDQRSNYLFVSGAGSGQAYVYDADTGIEILALQLAPAGNFINDVILTRDAAYFTSSFEAQFYRLPIGPGGEVARNATAQAIPLTGQWQQGSGFGANGIEATPDGRYLIIVNSTLGTLYRVDPQSGDARLIDLHGASVTAGDGLLLQGKTLYVVRNQLNQIAVFRMAPDFLSAVQTGTITDSDFDVPTTIARFGDWLYAVNAKFGTPSQGTPYEVVQVKR